MFGSMCNLSSACFLLNSCRQMPVFRDLNMCMSCRLYKHLRSGRKDFQYIRLFRSRSFYNRLHLNTVRLNKPDLLNRMLPVCSPLSMCNLKQLFPDLHNHMFYMLCRHLRSGRKDFQYIRLFRNLNRCGKQCLHTEHFGTPDSMHMLYRFLRDVRTNRTSKSHFRRTVCWHENYNYVRT